MMALAFADEEGADRLEIVFGGSVHPLAEFGPAEARTGDTFTPEKGRESLFYAVTLIHDNDHRPASESVALLSRDNGYPLPGILENRHFL
jgi:hypothetical protein